MGSETNRLRRLVPDCEPTTVAEYVEGLDFSGSAREDRPYLVCNFAATVDGQAAIDGRSGPIAGPADFELLLGLRSRVDALMVGAGTLRAERYGRVISDPEVRSRREAGGLSPDPLAVIVSGRLEIPWDIPLFTDGGGEVLILTSSEEKIPETETPTSLIRYSGRVDLLEAMRTLRGDRGIESVLCEGGPTLHGDLWREGLVDELFLTVGARIGGGSEPGILADELDSPVTLELAGLLVDDEGDLMCRYARVGSDG